MSQPIIIKDIENRVKDTGDVITGNLYLTTSGATTYFGQNTTTNREFYIETTTDSYTVIANRPIGGGVGKRTALWLAPETVDTNNLFKLVKNNDGEQNIYNILHSGNYTNFVPTKTGAGASGLWDISISGAANKLQGLERLTTTDEANNFLEDNVVKWAKINSEPMEGNDGLLMSFGWSSIYGAQMWLDDGANEGGMKIRNRKGEEGWHPWRKVITDSSLNDTLGGYVKKRDKGVYTNLGDYYAGGQTKPYIRIALPSDGSFWNMMILEITIRQLYSSGHFGKLYIYGHCYPSQDWTCFNAVYDGTLNTNLKVYGSDKKYIYVAGVSAWGGLSVDRMLLGDAAYSTDLSNVVIDGVDTLPSTYQTASMYKSWRQGDSITTPIGTDYTTKRARNVGANTSLSTPGNGEVWLVYA